VKQAGASPGSGRRIPYKWRAPAGALMPVMAFWNTPAFCDEIQHPAKKGNLAKVEVLIKRHPDGVASRDKKGQTALHHAARNGHKDIVELLLADKAEVDARDKYGNTPSSDAATPDGNGGVAELLLAHGAQVDARNLCGATALHAPAWFGAVDLAEVLVAHGADVNARTNEQPLKHSNSGCTLGETPLRSATARTGIGRRRGGETFNPFANQDAVVNLPRLHSGHF